MALLEGLDQYSAYYSVICVFGSVVGCVVVPLITQVYGFPGSGPLSLGYKKTDGDVLLRRCGVWTAFPVLCAV